MSDHLANATTQASLGAIGLIGLVIAASFVFVAVEDALGIIFDLSLGHGTENWVRRRALAFVVAVLVILLFVVIVALQLITGLLESLIAADNTVIEDIADLLGVVLSAGLGALALALLLRLMTFSQIPWRYALVGSLITAIGLAIGGWALGVYFSTIGAASPAAAIGGALAVLIFLYAEAQILLAGAELTNVIWIRNPFDDLDS